MQPPAMAQRGRKHEQATGTVTEREWATRSEGRKGTTEGDKGRKQKMWKKGRRQRMEQEIRFPSLPKKRKSWCLERRPNQESADFDLQHPRQKLGMVASPCNASHRDAKTGGSLGLANQPS